jgi:hypothetical protein
VWLSPERFAQAHERLEQEHADCWSHDTVALALAARVQERRRRRREQIKERAGRALDRMLFAGGKTPRES